jgi:hypothetical protein
MNAAAFLQAFHFASIRYIQRNTSRCKGLSFPSGGWQSARPPLKAVRSVADCRCFGKRPVARFGHMAAFRSIASLSSGCHKLENPDLEDHIKVADLVADWIDREAISEPERGDQLYVIFVIPMWT